MTGPGLATGPAPAAAPAASAHSADQGVPERRRHGPPRRRWRGPVAVVALVLLGAILVALAQPARPTAGYLDPGNPGPQGTRALAALLGQRGQPVVRVGSAAAARAALRGRAATLVLTSPYLLTAGQLSGLVAATGNVVVVEPDSTALTALTQGRPAGPAPRIAGAAETRPVRPGCALAAATAAGNALMGGVLIQDSAAGGGQCYRVNGHPSLVRYTAGGRSVTLLGTGAPLSNSGLAQRGDAALALNLLRGSPRIVWLVPSLTAAAGDQKSLLQVIPGPAYLVAVQLLIAAGLAALWRMRRLGPLVAEPLPVVVRAAETVEGHGRLYHSRRSRDRAAAVLRAAALRRLTARLALPATADPDAVSTAVAAVTGRETGAVRAILYGPTPRGDSALVTLGRDLDALEEEVRTQ
jgi:Domain of unknown function (DUF4350)